MAKEETNHFNQDRDSKSVPPPGGFRRSRKFVISLNTLLIILIAAVIVVMVNYLSIRHYKRIDLTENQYYSLSDKTIELLKTIKEPITCIVFFQPSQQVYDDVRNLLREYQDKTSQIKVEYVDPNRNLSRTEALMREYEVASANVVIFSRGEGKARKSKYVTATDIFEIDYGGAPFGGGPRRKIFKGEQAFTSAIQSILEDKQPTLYFLTGHGERDPDEFDERSGYSTLNRYLKRENLRVNKLNLATTNQVPSDCDVLIVAGPRKPIPPRERDILNQYLQNKGRMFVLVGAQEDSGLQDTLAQWGVTLDNNEVVAIFSLGFANALTTDAIGLEYGIHPIVEKMEGVNTSFPSARSLEINSTEGTSVPDRPRATWLVKSHEGFWGETSLTDLNKAKYDPASDKKGPLILAAAVESGNLPGTPVELASTRMVVVGSSAFVANGAINGANLDFFLNSVTWLLNKPERVIGISPKMPREFRLSLTELQLKTLKSTLIFGLPGGVAAIGIIVWWRRRK